MEGQREVLLPCSHIAVLHGDTSVFTGEQSLPESPSPAKFPAASAWKFSMWFQMAGKAITVAREEAESQEESQEEHVKWDIHFILVQPLPHHIHSVPYKGISKDLEV